MTTSVTPIKASDKLQTLFERDERLIDVMANHSPQLAKLRNSPMRRVMARVTTVAQAARLCKVPVEELVRDLNHVIGIDTSSTDTGTAADPAEAEAAVTTDDSSSLPSFESAVELDVRDELGKGGEPFSRIMAAVAGLGEGQVLHLRAPFEPVPLFAVMAKRGFGHKTEQHADDDWSVWFFRQKAGAEQPAAAAASAPAPATQSSDKATAHTPAEAESSGARTEVWLDVRDLEPPEPLVRTLEALETLPADNVLVQVNMRVPQFLLPILRERGFHFTIDESQANEVQVRIWRVD
jgi:uncharacterized protein (DUF2249 family)